MADIFRTIKNKNYTVMSNHHLQNPNLSLKAMGLMSKILSLPEDWNYSVKGLAAYCKTDMRASGQPCSNWRLKDI